MNIIVGDKGAISVLFPYMPLSCFPDCKIDFVEKKHSCFLANAAIKSMISINQADKLKVKDFFGKIPLKYDAPCFAISLVESIAAWWESKNYTLG